MTMVGVNKSQRTYLPAAGHDLFLPLYDLVAKLLGADQARQMLLDRATLRSGDRALDIGCGTGTFAVLLKQRFATAEVIGLGRECRFVSMKDLRMRLSIPQAASM
jgi:ubiquinone/menaquinone biosynthesis C-methylase UbiE